ncbi:RidA family protein [Caldiplasma sukawensis]
MDKKTVVVEDLGRAGPYVHATLFDRLVFLSGQLGVSKETLGNFTLQFEKAISNVKKILEHSGSSMEKVVRVVVYLSSADNFKEMNDLFEKYFGKNPVSRTTVVCSFPNKDALVELEVTAFI